MVFITKPLVWEQRFWERLDSQLSAAEKTNRLNVSICIPKVLLSHDILHDQTSTKGETLYSAMHTS